MNAICSNLGVSTPDVVHLVARRDSTFAVYLALNSPMHDGSVVAGAPIMAAPAVGWAAGEVLAGLTAPPAAIIGPSAGGLTTSQRDSLNSLASRLAEHEAKLNAYRANPDAMDNKAFLKNAPTPEIRQAIIDRRIQILERDIKNFETQIEKIKNSCE